MTVTTMATISAPTLATSVSVKANRPEGGWSRFIQWVGEGNPVLLAQRFKRTATSSYPVLAVAVPTSWIDSIEAHQEEPDVTVEYISSHQARQHLLPYCKKLQAAEADGLNMRYEVSSFKKSGPLRTESTAAARDDLFALVGVEWYAAHTGTTPRELAHVDATPPWIDVSQHR